MTPSGADKLDARTPRTDELVFAQYQRATTRACDGVSFLDYTETCNLARTLERETIDLRALLTEAGQYLAHKYGCDKLRTGLVNQACSCGLSSLLSRLREVTK
jgi:hypothetical protein